jgi:hypothetical protein
MVINFYFIALVVPEISIFKVESKTESEKKTQKKINFPLFTKATKLEKIPKNLSYPSRFYIKTIGIRRVAPYSGTSAKSTSNNFQHRTSIHLKC